MVKTGVPVQEGGVVVGGGGGQGWLTRRMLVTISFFSIDDNEMCTNIIAQKWRKNIILENISWLRRKFTKYQQKLFNGAGSNSTLFSLPALHTIMCCKNNFRVGDRAIVGNRKGWGGQQNFVVFSDFIWSPHPRSRGQGLTFGITLPYEHLVRVHRL